MVLPKTSTFSVCDNPAEVERLIKVAKNMGYKYKVQVQRVGECEITSVTWIRRA
jgi:hypothetical protein